MARRTTDPTAASLEAARRIYLDRWKQRRGSIRAILAAAFAVACIMLVAGGPTVGWGAGRVLATILACAIGALLLYAGAFLLQREVGPDSRH